MCGTVQMARNGLCWTTRQAASAGSSRRAAALEDTQLVFYALLGGADDPVQAAYLHLAPDTVTPVAHPDVREHADVLLSGLTHDWQRLREGAPMPALGEGGLCERCEARGLCRKDHWAPEPSTP